jgi:uncharacterized protein YkwD
MLKEMILCRSPRIAAAFAAAAVAAALAAGAVASPRRPAVALSPLEQGVLAEINSFRASHHLAALRLSPALTASARAHSLEMETGGYFGHASADGTVFWKRIERFYPSAGRGYWSVGENLLWSSPDIDAGAALTTWLGSPEHRANLLNPNWREIGVSAVHRAAAPGIFEGMDVTVVTTDFGVRRR